MRFVRGIMFFMACIVLWTAISSSYAASQPAEAAAVVKEGVTVSFIDKLKQKKPSRLLIARSLHLALQDGQAALMMLLTAQLGYAYHIASSAGISIAEPLEVADRSGVEIIRPAYGELNVVIRREQLEPALRDYAAIAIRTYATSIKEDKSFNDDVHLLKSGRFDYRAMLEADRQVSTAEHAPASEQLPLQLYTKFLLPDGRLLMNEKEQQTFAYLLAFYDASGNAIGYMKDELPLIDQKMSANPDIVALVYHHFTLNRDEINGVTVHPDDLRDQLQMLKKNGYSPIRQQDLLEFMEGGKEVLLPKKSVLITIDDGYESNYELAYPVIVEEQFFATIFAVTANVNKEMKYLSRITWPQSREMMQSGRIDIQSHTFESHYYGKTADDKEAAATTAPLVIDGQLETDGQYKQRMRDDLMTAKTKLEEQLHHNVFSFAYPYGSYNDELIKLLHETGHKVMYTVEEGAIRKGMDLAKLPRVNVAGPYSAAKLLRVIKKYL